MSHVQKLAAFAVAFALIVGAAFQSIATASSDNGVVRVNSLYSVDETVGRIMDDVAEKGISFFALIDQAELGTAAGIDGLLPSRLLLFGNPALGTTFITGSQEAGLDWPVRVLVYQTAEGQVRVAYNDFAYIARRHGIKNRDEQFAMATAVIQSVMTAVTR